ncbi:MAG: HU family DNA-binding protein [Gammaproteobacteria bacterium]
MKVYLVKKAATKAREGINPLTGKNTIFKAKPARKIVRIRPLKKLKEII